ASGPAATTSKATRTHHGSPGRTLASCGVRLLATQGGGTIAATSSQSKANNVGPYQYSTRLAGFPPAWRPHSASGRSGPTVRQYPKRLAGLPPPPAGNGPALACPR